MTSPWPYLLRAMIVLLLVAALPICGLLIGYFLGPKAGRREAAQGFPVVPLTDVPAAKPGEIRRAGDPLK